LGDGDDLGRGNLLGRTSRDLKLHLEMGEFATDVVSPPPESREKVLVSKAAKLESTSSHHVFSPNRLRVDMKNQLFKDRRLNLRVAQFYRRYVTFLNEATT
jgi:hypothetical protein